MKKILEILFLVIIISGFPALACAYGINAHKQIVVESAKIWQEIPQEILERLGGENRIDWRCSADYDLGDDIYIGSAEEDNVNNGVFCRGTFSEHTESNEGLNGFLEHFWDPDFPSMTPLGFEQRGYNCNDDGKLYNLGLLDRIDFLPSLEPECGDHFDSNYNLAQDYWENKVIPYYRQGRKDEAYYWLGRVAHLISDLGVPAHVQLRAHDPIIASKDLYEDFVDASLVRRYTSRNYTRRNPILGHEYQFECLPNLPCDFDWKSVHPNPTNLFKLFWYTAQKTQYWAGANKRENLASYGNDFYSTLDGNIEIFTPNLWNGEAFPFESPLQLTNRRRNRNLQEMADALIPHTLKAVAGLYRLFWMEVNAPECPNEFGPPGSLVYMCLVEGNPGIPGDGVIVDSVGDLNDVVDEIRFSLSQPISLRPLTNGITILAFPDSALPLKNDMQFFLEFSVANRPGCGWGLQTQATIGPEINGVQGYSLSLSLGYLFPSSCGGAGLDSVYITNVELFPLSEGRVPIVTRLDAVALGNGLWVLP